MYGNLQEYLKSELVSIRNEGLYKEERVLMGPQKEEIALSGGSKALNFCSNNYLGLANHPSVAEAAVKALHDYGYGLSSVRFICGTQKIHKDLEKEVSDFLNTEDTLLYAACFDANGGIFEPLLGDQDAIISDELNHASIIDGIRLCKAFRFRYRHGDMDHLEECLKNAAHSRFKLISTDGVFSMDGDLAKLPDICRLAEKYNALVMVDDSHATGYIGENGRGTAEHWGVEGKVDIITTTFGKALGGASGGCTSGRKEIIEYLRQKSRPYLFSNTLPPMVAGATLEVLKLLKKSSGERSAIRRNTSLFKEKMSAAGFNLIQGDTAIVPVMLYDESIAVRMAQQLLEEGIYVIGFSFPVVPRGKARIRVQLSAVHSVSSIEKAVDAFIRTGKELKIIP